MLMIQLRFFACSSFVAMLLLSGCASLESTRSGFLDDYGSLEKTDPKGKSLVYQNDAVDWSVFEGVKIEAVELLVSEDRLSRFTEEEIQDIREVSSTIFEEVFQQRFRASSENDETTICIRLAITDMDTVNVKMNAVTAILAVPVDAGGVSLEFEIINAKTKERLYAFSGYQKGKVTQVKGFFSKLGHVKSGILKIAEISLDAIRPVVTAESSR